MWRHWILKNPSSPLPPAPSTSSSTSFPFALFPLPFENQFNFLIRRSDSVKTLLPGRSSSARSFYSSIYAPIISICFLFIFNGRRFNPIVSTAERDSRAFTGERMQCERHNQLHFIMRSIVCNLFQVSCPFSRAIAANLIHGKKISSRARLRRGRSLRKRKKKNWFSLQSSMIFDWLIIDEIIFYFFLWNFAFE